MGIDIHMLYKVMTQVQNVTAEIGMIHATKIEETKLDDYLLKDTHFNIFFWRTSCYNQIR